MTSSLESRKGIALLAVLATLVTFCVTLFVGEHQSQAATVGPAPIQQPDSTVVTADMLPTAQLNGVAWKQLIVGNTVYVAGNFTAARPAGVAAGGAGEVTRNNMLAYDLTTGVLTSFAPSFNGEVNNLAVSPDGTTLYAVGAFTSVNGLTRNRIASFNVATGALTNNTFAGGANSSVLAVAVSNSTVYVGGGFTTMGGSGRSRLAAFTTAGSLTAWQPVADYKVNDMLISPSGAKIDIAGAFTTINGNNVYGWGAVDATSGASVSWLANQTVQSYGTAAAFLSLSYDGTNVYATSYNFHGTGNIEGAVAADPETGAIVWVDDCHGDTYGAYGSTTTVYTVGHPHYCGNLGGEPDLQPRQWRRAMALTKAATGTLAPDSTGYPSHYGLPAPSIITWAPDLNTGTFTGQGQAAWTVTGKGNYLALGGEFPSVNGVAQQGLVRFATRAVTTKPKSGPRLSGAAFTPTVRLAGPGQVRVAIQSNYDRDSQVLTYAIKRNGTAVWSGNVISQWWTRPMLGFLDTNVPVGVAASYTVTATDPDGNSYTSPAVTITPTSAASPQTSFDQQVVNDGATNYWPLNEASGTTVYDGADFDDIDAGTGVTRGTAGPFSGETGSTFNGTANGVAIGRSSIPSPNTVSVSAWVKTTTTSGGRIVGLGNNPTATSTNGDKTLYLDNSGKVYFGVLSGSVVTGNSFARTTIASSGAINNGSWHQVVGTYGNNTMSLWVDGQLVAQRTDVAPPPVTYNGWWRIGGDALTGWTNAPTSNYLNGSIASVATFPTALTRVQVQGEFTASGRTLSVQGAPTDAFGKTVFGDDPAFYYRLNEASGTVANDAGAYGNNGKYSGTVTYGQASAVAPGTAVKFNGSSGTIGSGKALANPLQYSTEAWFKTTTTTGGKIIGFGNAQTGSSASGTEDRHVYMLNSGQLAFGALNGSQKVVVTSANSYNDGQWHQVVATQGVTGMNLYVDGTSVGTNPNQNAGKYTGYWRIGGDASPWGGTSGYFNGTIDEVSQYNYVLSPSRVQAHYLASGTATNLPPNASFTASASGATATFDASGSSDPDGTITGYAWNFGDNATGSGPNPSHTYGKTGSYTVTLTVTDNNGATGTTTQPVNVTVNQPPTAAFTSSVNGLAASFDGTGSTDQNGNPVSSYSWNFGDGSPADTTATPTHTYAAPGTYAVTLTVTDTNNLSKSVTNSVTISATSGAFVNDTFARTVASGFGTADTGGAWTTTGTAGSYSVSPGAAAFSLTKGGQRGEAAVGSPQTASDVLSSMALSAVPVTTDAYLTTEGRRIDTANAYYAKVLVHPNGAANIRVAKYVGGTETSLNDAVVSGLSYTAGTVLNTRIQTFNTNPTTIRARVWVQGTAEPSTWQVTATDSTAALQTPGQVGVIGQLTSNVSNLPITASVSAFTASIPNVAGNPAPTAAFTPTITGDSVSFDGTASSDPNGTIANYAWNYGDGSSVVSGTSPTANHTYTQAGTYPVTLTVTDNGGATGSVTQSVTVNVAPNASFTATTAGQTASVDGSASADPDGTIASYVWTWGDGQTSTTSSPTTTHPYVGTGPFTISLTVADNSGSTSTPVTQSVSFAPAPTPSFQATPTNRSVAFDASASTPGAGAGSITSYTWDFGDGSSGTGVTTSHQYTSAGNFTVTLTVVDDQSGQASTQQSVLADTAPTATFSAAPAGLSASFDASASSDPDSTALTYSWDFGDGKTGGGQKVAHPYSAAGTYTVTLTVADDLGRTGTFQSQVTVSGPFVADTFNRTVTGGLGSADVGGAWTTVGTASKFSVAPGAAKLNLSTAGTKLEGYIGPQQTSADVLETTALDKVPAGGVAYLSVVGRRIDASNYYYAKLTVNTNGSLQIRLGALVGGVDTQIVAPTTVSGLTLTAGTALSIRFQVDGTSPTSLRARVWKAGTTEPTTWQVSGTDASAPLQTGGIVGLISYVTSTVTNVPIASTVTSFTAQPVGP